MHPGTHATRPNWDHMPHVGVCTCPPFGLYPLTTPVAPRMYSRPLPVNDEVRCISPAIPGYPSPGLQENPILNHNVMSAMLTSGRGEARDAHREAPRQLEDGAREKAALEGKLKKQSSKVGGSCITNQKLREEVMKLKKELKKVRASKDEEHQQALRELDDSAREKAGLEGKLGRVESKLAASEKQKEKLTRVMKELQELRELHKSKCEEHLKQLEDGAREKAALEGKLGKVEGKLAASVEENQKLKEEVSSSMRAKEQAQKPLQDAELESASLRSGCAHLDQVLAHRSGHRSRPSPQDVQQPNKYQPLIDELGLKRRRSAADFKTVGPIWRAAPRSPARTPTPALTEPTQAHNPQKKRRLCDNITQDEAEAEAEAEGLSLIHISEPTRLLSISYAVFCLKKKKKK
eukprot:TRINITY_DN12573_c0_g2_i4.p1 TRINITY_DN12573_c0_g2~~TRINITY_DN12573_c0_g2_i4.p1  ORF type:complete len:406 (+),score=103.76 TRINITY_DN12573_c0_g2_i4:254-1471(+)